MCELFAMSSKNPKSVNKYLQEFYYHSDQHPHGWGLACIKGNQVNIEKEPIQAIKSHYLKQRLSSPIKSSIVLSHIRYATIGNVEFENCHPYSMKDRFQTRWTLVHNGTIFHYPLLEKYVKKQEGSTDSERILFYIIDQINNQEKHLKPKDFFHLLDAIVTDMAKENKLNFILTDGNIVYVHTNYACSLYYLIDDESILFATTPLSQENWKQLPMTTLQAYKDGKLLYSGTNHHHEYFDNQENTKYLYQVFSDL